MTNIYDLANELERGIRALPEYKTLVEKSMLKCKLVQCQQQKNKQLFKNWVKR